MQRLSGFMLLLAGAALGAYTYLPAPRDAEEKLAEVTRISAAPDRTARQDAAPETSLIASLGKAVVARSGLPAATKPVASPVVTLPQADAVALDASRQSGTWTAVVTAERSNDVRLSSSKPGDSETRSQLARDLQRELKRVGCYGGEITGSWTPTTKRAMSAFMDRVNASLPVEEPDYILLTLVQGQVAAACGAECPSGQALSDGGRCVPNAVVAQASRKSQREEQRRAAIERKAADERKVAEEQKAAEMREAELKAETQRAAAMQERKVAQERKAAEDQKLVDARKAMVERRIADARASDAKLEFARKTAELSRKRVTVAINEMETLPWLEEAKADVATATANSARPAALPGMMAIGGPHQLGLDKPSTSAALDAASRPQIPAGQEIESVREPEAGSTDVPATSKPKSFSANRPVKAPTAPTVHRPSERPHAHAPRIVHRPSPTPAFVYRAPRQRSNSYASNYPRARRYYLPRSGSGHYNMMQSLGGIY